jgi:DNA replication licensing factor MCM6
MSSPSSRFGLPPSSLGPATPGSSSLPTSRPIIDPLAFDNVRGLNGSIPTANGGTGDAEAEVGEDITGRRRGTGRRNRLEDTDGIPRVKDATGEKVMESFALFLEKWASSQPLSHGWLMQV